LSARATPSLQVRRLHPDARLPTRAHPGDAGLDLYSVEMARLRPGDRASVATGIAISIPEGQAGLVLPRSGLAARHGITLVNAPGLIDAGYRGELRVLLHNTDRLEDVQLEAGDRIAQLVLVDVSLLDVEEVEELTDTVRGTGGFGSTGGFGFTA
jgi:dUTP pyrophosphatase